MPDSPHPFLLDLQERYPKSIHPIFHWGDTFDEEGESRLDYEALAPGYEDDVQALLDVILDPVMYVDDEEHGDEEALSFDEQAIWATVHAMFLLRYLAPAEAAEPLLKVFDTEDVSLIEALPAVYSAIGPVALEPLWAFAKDHENEERRRGFVLRIIGDLAVSHSSIREAVLQQLVEHLSREDRDQSHHEEYINASLISAICDIHAETLKEMGPEQAQKDPIYLAILDAYEANCVGDHVIDISDVQIECGIRGPWTDDERMELSNTPRISLACRACDRIRFYEVPVVYFDPGFLPDEGEEARSSYGPLCIPKTLSCSKCQSLGPFDLSPQGVEAVSMAAMMKELSIKAPDQGVEEHPFIRFIDFDSLGFGGHPRDAEAEFSEALKTNPTDPEFYIKYAEILIFLGHEELGKLQLTAALTLAPDHPVPYYLLALLAEQENKLDEAIVYWERVRDAASVPGIIPPREQKELLDEAEARLSVAHGEKIPKRLGKSKIRPNDPCPCGSGKKFKKCCMR